MSVVLSVDVRSVAIGLLLCCSGAFRRLGGCLDLSGCLLCALGLTPSSTVSADD